jgi:error-prone DNA polymerase
VYLQALNSLLYLSAWIHYGSRESKRNNCCGKLICYWAKAARSIKLPALEQTKVEDAYDEIELLGFPVSVSWFDLLKTKYNGNVYASDLIRHVGRTIKILGDLVTVKNVRTVKKEWMHFGCFLDARGEFFDTVNFPDSLKHYPFRGYGIYLILGTVVEEFGFPSIEVKKMAKLPFVKDPRY